MTDIDLKYKKLFLKFLKQNKIYYTLKNGIITDYISKTNPFEKYTIFLFSTGNKNKAIEFENFVLEKLYNKTKKEIVGNFFKQTNSKNKEYIKLVETKFDELSNKKDKLDDFLNKAPIIGIINLFIFFHIKDDFDFDKLTLISREYEKYISNLLINDKNVIYY